MIVGKTPVEARLAGSVVLLFTAGASLAAFFFLLNYDRTLEHVTGNVMDKPTRDVMIYLMGGTGFAFTLAPRSTGRCADFRKPPSPPCSAPRGSCRR